MSDNEEQINALVRRYREIGATVDELKAEQADIKAAVGDLVEVGWSGAIDGQPVHKREANRQFCPITAVGFLSAEQKNSVKETRYNEKLVRALVKEMGKEDDCMIARPDAEPVIKL